MAMKLYEENDIQNIANELRRYNETDNKYRVEDMTLGIQDAAKNIEDKLGTTKTVESTNLLKYENAKAYRILGAEYQGNIQQDTTTGKNLCNLNVVQDSRVIYNSDGTITINGAGGFALKFSDYTFKANTTYYMKWELISGSVNQEQIFMMPDNTSFVKKDTFAPFKFDSDTVIRGLWIHGGALFTNAVIRIWFSETQTDFEPYTNGASPNPDYPQEVRTLKGFNKEQIEIDGHIYEPYNSIGVRRINQLFDNELRQGSWNNDTNTTRVFSKNNLYLKANKKYILKTNLDITKYKFGVLVNDKPFPVTTSNFSYDSGWKTINELEFTTTQDGYFGLNLATLSENDNLTLQDFNKYQFDLFNDERIDYIDLKGNELLTTDKITIDNKGNVKLIKNWGKIVLDGSEDWAQRTNLNDIKQFYASSSASKIKDALQYCNYAGKYNQSLYNYGSVNDFAIFTNNAQFYIDVPSTLELDDFKAKLNEEPLVCYYQSKEPIEIELGKTTIKSLKGMNNVEILATLESTHMKETYMLNIQSKYLPKVTTEETSIDYVAQFPLDMTIEGNIKQETTTGKNLFDESIMPTNTMNGIKWEYTNKKIKISGTATDTYSHNENIPITLQAGTYYFVESGATNLRFNARFYNIDGELIANSERYNPFTISENATRIELLVEGITSGTSYNQEMNFMVSTTNGNYEPYTGGQPSPSPEYPQEIKTIENSLKITLNNGELEDSENYLFSQIEANLPEGEFIGKINDTYKDTLKVEYNEEDGQYHLNLYKNVGKVVLNGSENWYIQNNAFRANINNGCKSLTPTKCDYFIDYYTNKSNNYIYAYYDNYLLIKYREIDDVATFKTWLSTHNTEVYYVLAKPYVVDLGKQNKPIPFEGINNIKVLAELEPSKIKTTYYLDAKKYIEDTTSALLELGGEN